MRPDAVARLLPAVYQEAMPTGTEAEAAGSVLAALLSVMSAFHQSTEEFLADHRRFLEPWRARPDFLTALAGWVGLSPYLERGGEPNAEIADLRELTRRAAALARSRGTAESLLAMCELVTGHKGFAVVERLTDADGRPLPFHFRLVAPEAASAKRNLIDRIVANEKPCFVTAEIVFSAATPDEEKDHAELPDR